MQLVFGKGGYRNINNILQYVIPNLVQKGILNPYQPIINLQISGDGRNVGRKVKHVMITIDILDDKNTLHKPNYYYTTILYPGCEDYDSLSNAMAQFCYDSKNFCPWCTINKSQQGDLLIIGFMTSCI